jgi:hypothetical protein
VYEYDVRWAHCDGGAFRELGREMAANRCVRTHHLLLGLLTYSFPPSPLCHRCLPNQLSSRLLIHPCLLELRHRSVRRQEDAWPLRCSRDRPTTTRRYRRNRGSWGGVPAPRRGGGLSGAWGLPQTILKGSDSHSRCFDCVEGSKKGMREGDGSSVDDITTYNPACIVTYPVLCTRFVASHVSLLIALRVSAMTDAHREYNCSPYGTVCSLDVRGQRRLSRPTAVLLRRLLLRSLVALCCVSSGFSCAYIPC